MRDLSYTFENLSEQNLFELPDIFYSSFKKNKTTHEFVKKFNVNNLSFGYLAYISRDVNLNAVSYYGVYPLRAIIKNEIIWTSQSGDTMTDPNHAGKGLFIKCAKLTYRLAQQRKINSVFGFPSKSSYKGFIKLGWKFPYEILRIRLISPTIPLYFIIRYSNLVKLLHKRYCQFLLSLLPVGFPFPGILSKANLDHICHDINFWSYKLQSSSNYLINLFGVNYFLKYDEGKLILGDFDFNDDSWPLISQLALRILSIFMLIPVIDYYASPSNPNLKRIFSIGGTTKTLPFGYMSFDNCTDLSKLCFTSMDFDTF